MEEWVMGIHFADGTTLVIQCDDDTDRDICVPARESSNYALLKAGVYTHGEYADAEGERKRRDDEARRKRSEESDRAELARLKAKYEGEQK